MRKVLAGMICTFWVFAQPLAAEPVKIAALGDSLVHGYGLPQDQGFVPQLQGWLRAKGAEVELINAGVSGDTTAGGAARIAWTLSDRPDGLIVLLGGNDLLRGIAPEAAKENLRVILAAAQAQDVEVMLIGMKAPRNYGPDYKVAFDAIYPDLAEEYGALLFEDAFAGMAEKSGGDTLAVQALLQGDGIHPNAAGVALNVAAAGPTALELVGRLTE